MPSSSFCLCSNSSCSASWLESSQEMVSLHLSTMVFVISADLVLQLLILNSGFHVER